MKKFLSGFLTAALIFGISATVFATVGSQQITVHYGDIKVFVDEKQADLKDANGNAVEPFIYNGTTYLPVRAISESLGKEVSWDQETKSVYVGIQPTKAAITVPAEVQGLKDKVVKMAGDYAKKLDGAFGDQHVALMASKKARDFEGFADMKAKLDGFRTESGATYVYVLVPEKAENPENFLITVDGSAEPDDWLAPYETEIQFTEAMAGAAAAARSAWGNGDDGADPQWSAFAPIHDSKGNVVAILGIDYPAPIIDKYPEWNRDKAEWNKVEE